MMEDKEKTNLFRCDFLAASIEFTLFVEAHKLVIN